MSILTEEQKSSIKYFWQEKGDIERYCDFKELKPLIQEEYPELLKAWKKYNKSIEKLNRILASF